MNRTEETHGFEDLFDRLPDDIVLSIFNKLHDAKSLCLSMSVCKRFHSIVPKVDEVFLSIPWKRGRETGKEYDEEISSKNSFKHIVARAMMKFKPIRFISRMMKFRSRNENNNHYVPNDVLKPFDEMRTLHLRLPCHGFQRLGSRHGENCSKSTTFLKWKAEFGSQLESCVIVGARSWSERCENREDNSEEAEGGLEQESRVMTEVELKLRIVWTLSCLMAASARHYLIQETLKDRKMVENVVVSDESDQGVICMDKEQIEEMRDLKGKEKGGILTGCKSLRMKIWYAEKMELPGFGKVMNGATLVVIRPEPGGEGRWRGRSNADLAEAAFSGDGEQKLVREFARKLVLIKKCLTLEMNAF